MGCGASRNQVAPCPAPSVATNRTANDTQPHKVRFRLRGNKVAPDLNTGKHIGPSSEREHVERDGGEAREQQPPAVELQPTDQLEQGQQVHPPTEGILCKENCTEEPSEPQGPWLSSTMPLGSPIESHGCMPVTDLLGERPTETLLAEPHGNVLLAEALEQGQKEVHHEEPSEQQQPPLPHIQIHPDMLKATVQADAEFATEPSTIPQIVRSEIDTSPCVTPSQIKAGLRLNPLAHTLAASPLTPKKPAEDLSVPIDNGVPVDSVDYDPFTRPADEERGVSFDQPPNFDKILSTPNKDRVKGPTNRQPRHNFRSSGEDSS